MTGHSRATALLALAILCLATPLGAEVLVRWDQTAVPPRPTLGVAAIVLPAANVDSRRSAAAEGYRVIAELEPSALAAFSDASVHAVVVSGKTAESELEQLRRRLKLTPDRVLTVQPGAKWPHIRTNWVTRNNEVLQVAGRSAQPWIETNAALLRIVKAERPSRPPLVTYVWEPVTQAENETGPSLENYLVAIAEAGSFGADLILPLHPSFQKRLLAGDDHARAEWAQIRRFLDFYSRDLPDPQRLVANVAVVTSQPLVWFEVMNLLARHNVPFVVATPSEITTQDLQRFKLVILLDPAPAPDPAGLEAFTRRGGKVHRVTTPVPDPNRFAFEMRKLLGADDRTIDIWNGITVLVAPYRRSGREVLVTLVNYAHQEMPVQVRVRGTFSTVHFESPDQQRSAIPHQHRLGFTEFVLPALRVGGRVFLGGNGIN